MARRLLLVVTLALALPGVASAGLASLEVHEIPLGNARALSATRPVSPFQLVGVHWQGAGRVELRTRSARGWSPWLEVQGLGEDGPDPGSREARQGWRVGAPLWVGSAVALELRTTGRVTRARALTVRSPVSNVPYRTTASPGMPTFVTRSGWLADEKIVKAQPAYSDTLRMAHVHHTAGTNTYTRLQAPAVVRAIEVYHVQGNGWNDIGYNALVDRFGTVYEGRAGGLDRNVVGAHAKGFNTGSFGIAVMGDFRTVDPPKAAVDALVRTLAWRLDLAHVDPLSTFNGISSGNERFGSGVPVFLRVISGHRDTGLTTCPGERLFAQLGDVARRVGALGLPKLYAPSVAADESGGRRFRARVSSALPWAVVVTDAAGSELARGSGTGTAVDWTWRPLTAIPPGTQWRIETPGATAAVGTLAATAPVALRLTRTSVTPATISPNGDGQADAATIAFTLTADATVDAAVLDAAGNVVAELEAPRWRRAGAVTVALAGDGLADGAYVVRVTARATGGREVAVDLPVTVTRALGRVTLSTPALTPNGDGATDSVSVVVPVAEPSTLTVRILREGRWVATPFAGAVEPGEHVASWDGTKRLGRATDGAYTVAVEAVGATGTARVELPLLVDATAPRVRVVSAEPPRLEVSEAATLALRVNGARRTLRVAGPGTVRIPRIVRLRTLVGTVTDVAGNRTVLRR